MTVLPHGFFFFDLLIFIMTYDFDELTKPFVDKALEAGHDVELAYELICMRIETYSETPDGETKDLSTIDPEDRTWSMGHFTVGEAEFLYDECYKRLPPD